MHTIPIICLLLIGCATNRGNESATPAECGYPRPDGPRVYAETDVDDPPRLLTRARTPAYPLAEFRAGKEGHVRLAFVIDDAGLVLVESIHVLMASDSAFAPFAREAIVGAHFAPAKVGGQSVAVCVGQTFNWVAR